MRKMTIMLLVMVSFIALLLFVDRGGGFPPFASGSDCQVRDVALPVIE